MTDGFLCVITPIFDPALEPAKCLIKDLQDQTFGDFSHVLISNGESPLVKEYVQQLDARFIYDEIPFKKASTPKELVCNISERRRFCLEKYDSQRYLFLNADMKLLDIDYFKKLSEAHLEADILITNILNRGTILPRHPIRLGRIDASNYSISQKIAKAKKCQWPIDYHPLFGIANDYRFFKRIGAFKTKFLPFISAEKDGHNKGSYYQISHMA
jgi:hypothetical protein